MGRMGCGPPLENSNLLNLHYRKYASSPLENLNIPRTLHQQFHPEKNMDPRMVSYANVTCD